MTIRESSFLPLSLFLSHAHSLILPRSSLAARDFREAPQPLWLRRDLSCARGETRARERRWGCNFMVGEGRRESLVASCSLLVYFCFFAACWLLFPRKSFQLVQPASLKMSEGSLGTVCRARVLDPRPPRLLVRQVQAAGRVDEEDTADLSFIVIITRYRLVRHI